LHAGNIEALGEKRKRKFCREEGTQYPQPFGVRPLTPTLSPEGAREKKSWASHSSGSSLREFFYSTFRILQHLRCRDGAVEALR
jgi:hypothetical protein